MKTTKYKYLKVIQQNYGHGWEDVSEYELIRGRFTEREPDGKPTFYHDLKEYRSTGYATRSIDRKELNPEFIQPKKEEITQ